MKSIKQIMREANISPDVDKRELAQELFQTYNEIQNLEKTYKIIAKKFNLQTWQVSDFDKENRITDMNESLSLKKLVREAENWPYYDFKDGYLYGEDDPKNPAFKVKFNSSIEAEKWLEDNNERGTVRHREAGPNLYRTRIRKEDAQDYHDSDSGTGMIMDPNKSEMIEGWGQIQKPPQGITRTHDPGLPEHFFYCDGPNCGKPCIPSYWYGVGEKAKPLCKSCANDAVGH